MGCLRRLLLGLHTFVLIAMGASQVSAQDLFGNPFASAETLRLQRGALPNATLRVRYQAGADPIKEKSPGELVIDVASDWAHVQRAGRQVFYDFRLGRVIELRHDGTFVSQSLMSDVTFRVYERQNRTALTHVLRGAGATDQMDACDAETELGVAIPGSKEPAAIELKQSGATATLECNGRAVGTLESGGAGEKAPAALWPVLAREMTMHPALQSRISDNGSAPRRVEAVFRLGGQRKALSWRLVSAERIAAPYPLAAKLSNASAASIFSTVAPGFGDLAAEAVAGRALGGPPTFAAWEEQVGRIAKEKGAAAATFAMWPALNMFPQLPQSCQTGAQSAMCGAIRNLRTTVAADAAVRALLDVVNAEQLRKPAEAIAAMVAARSSPHADHPVLGAAFALALHSGGDGMRKQAQAAGVPSEARALHLRALQAYPYNPAYWTDLGDDFARGYDLAAAYALYDVALSLPMPDAQRGNAVLAGKRNVAARLRSDFPAFFLPK